MSTERQMRATAWALAVAALLTAAPLWADRLDEGSASTMGPSGDDPPSTITSGNVAASASDSPAVDDVAVDLAEPDFVVITLPTTLRLPRHRAAFRVTHRFDRPLGEGDFGDLAADFFGFDAGGVIGLEFRFGLFTGTDIGVYRTSERTVRFFAQQELVRQGDFPFGLALTAGVEGLDNFQEEYSPQVGLVLSRKLGTQGALYAVPFWVGNTNLSLSGGDESTVALGLGARVRVRESVSLVAEWTPRILGFKGNRGGREAGDRGSFGIEKRVGGHSFQLNFSSDLGTTPAEAARGRQGADGWFIGFNISRKFY